MKQECNNIYYVNDHGDTLAIYKLTHNIPLSAGDYQELERVLTKPPFDKPISFLRLFDAKTRDSIVEAINQVRENAVEVTA